MKLIRSSMEQVALEAISFQSPAFSNKLVEHFTKILTSRATASQVQGDHVVHDIIELVFKHTGLRIRLLLDTDHPCACMPAYLDPNSILLPDIAKGMILDDYNAILSKLEKNKETTFVDLKNCRVGGLYSKIESPIYMPYSIMKQVQFTPREAVAVFLHELGHLFVAYELAFRTVTTNQILAAVQKSHQKHGLSDQHTLVLKRAGKAIGNDEAFIELTEIKDNTAITTVVMTEVQREAASEMGLKSYDETGFESLADNFAARHGYARDQVTALVKLAKFYGLPEYSSLTRVLMIFNEVMVGVAFPLLGVVMTILGIAAAGGLLIIYAALLLALATFAWATGGDAGRDFTYDDAKVRYQRLREQIVTYLKNDKLPKEEVKHNLESLAVIDKAIAEVKEYKGFLRTVANFLIPANRRAVKGIELQRQLEELAANDIYIMAAKLRGV